MKVEAVALEDFVHGDINASTGKLLRHRDGTLVSDVIAGDLERLGRCRIRTAQTVQPAQGKPQDDGQGQPSSASPAAPVSQPLTSASFKSGGGKTRKQDA